MAVKGIATVSNRAGKVKKSVCKKATCMSQRGTGLKFNVSSYEFIVRLTGKTRVRYVPNPKQLGTKSHARYAKYQNSKTVADAVKHCKPADLLWEYERGYFKVFGPVAQTPAWMNPDSPDPVVRLLSKFHGPRGNSIKMDPAVRKKCEHLAKQYGMDLDEIHDDAGKQCNSENADVQTQRLLANEMAKRKLAAKRRISDQDLVDVLRIWGFSDNASRINVLPKGVKSVHSDTLGVIRTRNGIYRIFDPTTRYPSVTTLVCQWFHQNKGSEIPEKFAFTGININANYAGKRHRDNNNEGPSAIRAVGKFTGGKLDYFPGDVKRPGRASVEALDAQDSITLDLTQSLTLFNGNNAHGVQPFKGDRYSLVFFTGSGYNKIASKERATLTKLGFVVPTDASMAKVQELSRKLDLSRIR